MFRDKNVDLSFHHKYIPKKHIQKQCYSIHVYLSKKPNLDLSFWSLLTVREVDE